MPKFYDVAVDAEREVTQADVDRWMDMFARLGEQRRAMPEQPAEKLTFRLACFQNPMRNDGLFIAEDKEVAPYEGVRGLSGEPLYPPVPKTRYVINAQVDPDFARELVRRWNSGRA